MLAYGFYFFLSPIMNRAFIFSPVTDNCWQPTAESWLQKIIKPLRFPISTRVGWAVPSTKRARAEITTAERRENKIRMFSWLDLVKTRACPCQEDWNRFLSLTKHCCFPFVHDLIGRKNSVTKLTWNIFYFKLLFSQHSLEYAWISDTAPDIFKLCMPSLTHHRFVSRVVQWEMDMWRFWKGASF